MTQHLRYSKGLHILILCCFLLPFFNTSCDGPKEEREDTALPDTLNLGDTTHARQNDSIVAEMVKQMEADTNRKPKKSDEFYSLRIIEKAPFLKPVLSPSENIYSGLATVIDSCMFITLFLTPVAFLLIIISLVAKFIEKGAGRRTIVLLELLAFISLLFAQSLSFDCERLWGAWVAICLTGLLVIYDIYINRWAKKHEI